MTRQEMFRHWALLICCTLWGFIGASHLHAGDDYQQIADKAVQGYLADHPQAAVTVGILDSNGTHVFGFGQFRKDDPHSLPDGKTIYQIGSITKTFTCTLLAEQVVIGDMQLDGPAQEYLPADLLLPKEKDREITLADLATHHSGLPRLPQLANFFMLGGALVNNPYAGNTWDDMPRVMRTVWLSTPIGKQYGYSNLAMGLLGQAVVHSTKSKNFGELVAERISKPLGLADTGVELSDEQSQRLVQGYTSLGQMAPPWVFDSLEGAGALYSTVDDLLIYAAANVGLRETDLASAMQLAQKPRPECSWPGGAMGLGWHLQNGNATRVWHNGMTGGYASMLMMVPDRKLAVVVLSNVAAVVDGVAYDIVDELMEGKAPPVTGGTN